LFATRKPDTRPRIIHFGSGDSVRDPEDVVACTLVDKRTDCTIRSSEERI
jgi:hypothetical protein